MIGRSRNVGRGICLCSMKSRSMLPQRLVSVRSTSGPLSDQIGSMSEWGVLRMAERSLFLPRVSIGTYSFRVMVPVHGLVLLASIKSFCSWANVRTDFRKSSTVIGGPEAESTMREDCIDGFCFGGIPYGSSSASSLNEMSESLLSKAESLSITSMNNPSDGTWSNWPGDAVITSFIFCSRLGCLTSPMLSRSSFERLRPLTSSGVKRAAL
jgi:hypothetical protein